MQQVVAVIRGCGRRSVITGPRFLRYALQLVFLLSVLLGGASTPLKAQDLSFDTKARFAFVMDADKNIIFYEKNARQQVPPASMSKLMTLALVFRDLKSGKLNLSDEVKMSVHAWRTGGAPSRTISMFVPVKAKVTVEQLIRGTIVQSANDAAIALGEHIAGSEDKFADMMTAYGKEIGLEQSVFKNASGLPKKGHLMSVRDLGLLAQHIIKTFPEYYHYFSETSFKYRRFTFNNLNPLIKIEEGYDGLNTGYSESHKFGVVTSLKRKGRRLIAVLYGLPKQTDRLDEAKKLVDWTLDFYKLRRVEAQSQKFTARIWGGEKSRVGLSTAEDLKVYAPRDEAVPDIYCEIVYQGPLKAPITQGAAVAKLRLKVGETEQEFDLYADESVKRAGFVNRAFDSLFYLLFGWLF